MSNIPKAREFVQAAIKLAADGSDKARLVRLLVAAERLLYRDPMSRPRAPVEANPITPELRAKILKTHRQDRRKSIQSLAIEFKTGGGRISEVISGKR